MAGAGTGKTQKILSMAEPEIAHGSAVLVITYTIKNQCEIKKRFIEKYGRASHNFDVKGLFSFYLEDLVRPYQQVLSDIRIENVEFTNRDPHLIQNGMSYKKIIGKKEDDDYNKKLFLTPDMKRAYTYYLAKLACQISKNTGYLPEKRLEKIYKHIYFDEVQDLIGWDYEVLKILSEETYLPITCVGDFRQTVYTTVTPGNKPPKSSYEKRKYFLEKLNFTAMDLKDNYRCVQAICEVAAEVHGSDFTICNSKVDECAVAKNVKQHMGVFSVVKSNLDKYIKKYDPVVLRWNKNIKVDNLSEVVKYYNFGECKGLSFDRVLIYPTENMKGFVFHGHGKKTLSEEVKNKLYVAITRARYSVAFIIDDKDSKKSRFQLWNG